MPGRGGGADRGHGADRHDRARSDANRLVERAGPIACRVGRGARREIGRRPGLRGRDSGPCRPPISAAKTAAWRRIEVNPAAGQDKRRTVKVEADFPGDPLNFAAAKGNRGGFAVKNETSRSHAPAWERVGTNRPWEFYHAPFQKHRFYARGTAGGDCDHRHFDCPALAGRASGAGGGTPGQLRQ